MPAARLKEATLLHYTSAHKPWLFRFRGLGAEIFLRHKRQSPWRFKPPTFRLVYRLRNVRAGIIDQNVNAAHARPCFLAKRAHLDENAVIRHFRQWVRKRIREGWK